MPDLADSTMPSGAAFPAVFAHVDLEYSPELDERFGIDIYPTFKLFRDGLPEPLGSGAAPKTAAAIVAAARDTLGLSPTSYAQEVRGTDDFLSWLFFRGWSDLSFQTTVVGFFPDAPANPSDAKAMRAAFDAAAKTMVGTMRFGVTSDPDIFKLSDVAADAPSVVLYKAYDEGKEFFTGAPDADAIVAWAEERSHPLAIVIDASVLRKWQNSVDVLVHLFVDERGTQEPRSKLEFLSSLRTVAHRLEDAGLLARGKALFTAVDAEKHKAWLKGFRLEDMPLPSLGLVDTVTDRFYAMKAPVGELGTVGEVDPEDKTVGDSPTVDVDAITEFIKGVLAGVETPVRLP